MEIWNDIEGYEGKYLISNFGNVFSYLSGKVLKPTIDNDGYAIVGLFIEGKQKKKKVHRLVAETFIPNPNKLPQVNHKDEDKSNNHVENLEWCDVNYNINYGTRNIKTATALKENENKKRRKIVCLSKDGEIIKIYPSLRSVEEDGFNHGVVFKVCTNYDRTKTHKGYLWEYYNQCEKVKEYELS